MRILLVAIISFLTFNANAQDKPVREFVVGMTNDTIYGQLSVSSANRRIKSVEFVREGSTFAEELGVKQIAGFYDEVWGLYITGDIVEKSNFTEPVTKRVFLEVVVLGKLDLLAYNNQGETIFFLRRENENLEELILIKYDKVINGKQLKLKDEKYKRLLSLYMADCSTISNEKVELKEDDLKRLFIDYHLCIGLAPKYVAVKAKGKWEFGATAGIVNSIVSFENGERDTYVGPQIGIYTEYYILAKNPKLSLVAELNYRKLEADIQYTANSYYGYFNWLSTFDIDLTYLRLNTFLKYKVTKNLFVLGGISNSFAISSHVESYLENPNSSSKLERQEEIRKYEQGLIFGMGFHVKKFSFQARYESSNGFTELIVDSPPGSLTTPKSKVSSYYLLAAYKF